MTVTLRGFKEAIPCCRSTASILLQQAKDSWTTRTYEFSKYPQVTLLAQRSSTSTRHTHSVYIHAYMPMHSVHAPETRILASLTFAAKYSILLMFTCPKTAKNQTIPCTFQCMTYYIYDKLHLWGISRKLWTNINSNAQFPVFLWTCCGPTMYSGQVTLNVPSYSYVILQQYW